jgi:hypothetical protein
VIRKAVCAAAFCALLLGLQAVRAHHSFAVYDFDQQIEFVGTVDELNFKNPHISMTLKVVDADGDATIIDFIEGAPANMLARKGLRPDMIAEGTQITAIGSPLIADPSKYFLRRVRLADGREFE